MIKDYVGWFRTFFQNFFFLYTGIFKSLPLQNHSIGNHPKWDLTTLGGFFSLTLKTFTSKSKYRWNKGTLFYQQPNSSWTYEKYPSLFHTQRAIKESILSIKTKNSFFFVSFAQLLQPLIARKISAAIYVLILKCSQLPMWTNKENILLLFVS